MKRYGFCLVGVASVLLLLVLALSGPASEQEKDDGKLRIIVFGAHPDDCEIKAGGVAAMWAAQSHHVKFVSTTNGDIGHAEAFELCEYGGRASADRLKELFPFFGRTN